MSERGRIPSASPSSAAEAPNLLGEECVRLRHLPNDLRELIESGPLAHLSTIDQDGSPRVTVVWIGWRAMRLSPATCTTI